MCPRISALLLTALFVPFLANGSHPSTALAADDPADSPAVTVGDVDDSGTTNADNAMGGSFRLVNQPQTGDQPEEPLLSASTASRLADAGTFGGLIDLSALPAERQAAAGGGASDVVLGSEAEIRNTTDADDLLNNSSSTTGIFAHHRNPISNDPRIRGFRFSQIRGHINGALWVPIRPDFDTPLSKLDSSIIRDMIVVKGPYSVRQGPGFAFIDVELNETPRYQNGYQWGGRTAFIFDTNGDQFNGRQSIWGGTCDSGYRIGYADRGGVDYRRGDGRLVASGYRSHDWDFAYGLDLSSDSRVEFNYQRVDQTDIELPSQYFDVDYLAADGFSIRFVQEDQCRYDRLVVDAWWNRSRFSGNANNATKQGIRDLGLGLIAANGNIGEVRSTGTRAAMTWGEAECTQVTAGGDFAFMDEEYVETGASYFGTFGLPRSQSHDPGLFSDAVLPINEWLSLKAGSRIDWTKISAVPGTLPQPAGDEQNFTLGAGYLSAECRLDHAWVATAGFGYAERAPTPTDLYALTFLEILQPGGDLDFRGNVNVRKEQLSQFDLGITFAYDAFRGGLHGYSGWVDDYVTYQWNAGVMRTENTNARLSGGEFYAERDLTSGLSAFGNISYVQAKDLIRDEPLWGIPPLESRVGLRIKQVGDDPTWGMEFAVRIADDQDRIARAIFTDGISSASLGEQVTPGFTTCDLRGYYRINRALRLVAGVENIGDRNYQEHLDSRRDLTYAAPGGVFRAGVNGYMGLISTY